MQNIAKAKGEIKAIAEACTGTPTAKLIAILAAAGITKATDIAAIIGISERAVYKVRSGSTELQDMNPRTCPGGQGGTPGHELQDSTEPQDMSSSSVAELQDMSHSSVEPRARARVKTTRATNELPSEVVITKKDSPSSVPPISGSTKPRGARLDTDWTLPPDWSVWTASNFPHASPDRIRAEAEKFRDYWHAKAGQSACKADWAAAWRYWCRVAFCGTRQGTAPAHAGMTWQEQRAKRELQAMLRKKPERTETVEQMRSRIAAHFDAETQRAIGAI